MSWLYDAAEFATDALVLALCVMLVAYFLSRLLRQDKEPGHLQVRILTDKVKALSHGVRLVAWTKAELKQHRKQQRRLEKKAPASKPLVFVLEFEGDLAASAVRNLRQEITAILGAARPGDEVLLRLESSGGAVHGYGLAASQLQRLRDQNIHLTVAVDKVAASGGYMMACVAHEILAAPFAYLGSIGVVAPVPNLHRLLQQHGVDYEEMTAGEFKRTVSLLGAITPEGRKKFQEQLEETHLLFKRLVTKHRPQLKLDQVATGEHWLGERALELGLVDRLLVSDDFLLAKMTDHELVQIKYREPHSLSQRMARYMGDELDRLALRWWERLGPNVPPLAR